MIEFQNVSKTFHSKQGRVPALKKVSLKVEEGEIFGIIGLSGAGKSTLLRLVNGLETFEQGKLVVDGIDLKNYEGHTLRELRQRTGMVFQHYHLMNQRRVSKNIAFPLELHGYSREEIDSRVAELLKVVNLEDKEQHYPAALSGGQRQRVAIARALATKPKILLCDEATSSLDPITGSSILALLKKINRELGVTVLMISHQLSSVSRICHRVGVLKNGELIEQGPREQVFSYPAEHYTRLLINASEIHGELLPRKEVV